MEPNDPWPAEDRGLARERAIEDFQSEYKTCENIFDLFAYLWKLVDGRVDFWASDEEFEPTASFDLAIRQSDGGIPGIVRSFLSVPEAGAESLEGLDAESFLHRCAAVLRSIDIAAESLNDFKSDPHPDWASTSARTLYPPYRLNPDSPGIVTLKPTRAFGDERGNTQWWTDAITEKSGKWQTPAQRGQNLSRDMENLLWIGPIYGGELQYKRLSGLKTAADHIPWDKLRIGYVPLVEQIESATGRFRPGNLVLRRSARHEPRFEIVEAAHPTDSAKLCDAAERGLLALVEKGCQLVLYPEAVVPDPVVNRLQQVLRNLCLGRQPRPYLVLAGTFSRPEGTGNELFNTAVVLDSRGQVLFRQRKMHRYAMHPYEQKRYGIETLLNLNGNVQAVEEDVSIADRTLMIRDLGGTGMRLAIAICEDSAQLMPHWVSLLQAMPNLVLMPVMAGPLSADRGFAGTTASLSNTIGAVSAVVNSACLPRRDSIEPKAPHRPIGIFGFPLQSGTTFTTFGLLDDPGVSSGLTSGGVTTLYVEFPLLPNSVDHLYF